MTVCATAPLKPAHPKVGGSPETPGLSDLTATRLALALLTLGFVWRTVRYLMQFPIWGDEAMLALNLAWFDYSQLTQRLENCQVAPLLFLWGERAAYTGLGAGELSLRLLPYLAGTVSLALYWRLTGLLLTPQARLFAVGFLAVAHFPVAMCNLLKPYSFDLMMALALTSPAAEWLKSPTNRWLGLLALVAPLALLGSYPAVFVAGGVSLALAGPVWQQGWCGRLWFVLYNAAVLFGFLMASAVASHQLQTATGGTSTQTGMAAYWAHGFPPESVWSWPRWFILATTGQMTAFPIGDANGGSILTVICCVVGARLLWRQRRLSWLILFTAPLLLNLIAAAMHRYPYGAAARLSQHLAPGLCMLAGLGLAGLVAKAPEMARRKWAYGFAVSCACIGAGGLVRDIVRPYYSVGANWMRTAMNDMRSQVPSADWVILCGDSSDIDCVYLWSWMSHRQRTSWRYQVSPDAAAASQVWGFHQGLGADLACLRLWHELGHRDPAWRLVKRIPYVEPAKPNEQPQRCELFCFQRG